MGVMDGPLILPPVLAKTNTRDSSLLWDVSTAFRHSVELALIDGSNRNRVRAVAPSSNAGNKDSGDKDRDLSYFSDTVTATSTCRMQYPIPIPIPVLLQQE